MLYEWINMVVLYFVLVSQITFILVSSFRDLNFLFMVCWSVCLNLQLITFLLLIFGCWKSLFYACYVCPPRVNVLPVLEIFNIDRMQNFWWLEVLQKWICTNYINYPFFLCTGEQISGDGYSWLAESMWNDKRKR